MKDVAVLGCGPAGLLCALAMEQEGHHVHIYSRKVRSKIPGSVYLHRSVPDLTGVYPDNHVQYVRLGDEAGYARKVYGDAGRTTGWPNYYQVYPSWNAVAAYDKLWERYDGNIIDRLLAFEDIRDIVLGHDYTITTLPVEETCYMSRHQHEGQPYWIKTLPLPPLDGHHDIVVYNGIPTDLWYRWSVLSGVCSIESTYDLWPNDPDVKHGIKAVRTDCDCWLNKRVTRAGRWAQWRHGVLLNDAYDTARELGRDL